MGAQAPRAIPESGTADSGDAALAFVRRERPDVVLMDIRMPGRDGVSTTAAITEDLGFDPLEAVTPASKPQSAL